VRYDERPLDDTPVHTADLPLTPTRDRNIPATAWVEAPDSGGDARYWAASIYRLDEPVTLRLYPDGTADGFGPSGTSHDRFRAWEEDLRDGELE
jgi:hypothetical protein